jgi:hypothetical protein
MAEIRGVAFPIPKQFAQRFFEGKDVFVKLKYIYMYKEKEKRGNQTKGDVR